MPESKKENLVRLLALSVELNDQILTNAGLARFIDLSTGTGMTHLGWSRFRAEAQEVLEANSELDEQQRELAAAQCA